MPVTNNHSKLPTYVQGNPQINTGQHSLLLQQATEAGRRLPTCLCVHATASSCMSVLSLTLYACLIDWERRVRVSKQVRLFFGGRLSGGRSYKKRRKKGRRTNITGSTDLNRPSLVLGNQQRLCLHYQILCILYKWRA